jgi:tRNA wybutosine-synthesizing protein 1
VEENSPREMVTTSLRDSLTKQGYRIVGTHSGVKLCRWTKVLLTFPTMNLLTDT